MEKVEKNCKNVIGYDGEIEYLKKELDRIDIKRMVAYEVTKLLDEKEASRVFEDGKKSTSNLGGEGDWQTRLILELRIEICELRKELMLDQQVHPI